MFLGRYSLSAMHLAVFIPLACNVFRHTREVMSPKRSNLILPSHIPDIELDILIRDGLDVEANSRNGSDVGVELQLVEDCYRL